ncbi:hypothetical protein FOXYSP1_08962, partial [Fusarium oxysporum f. sp. phaseoli]
SLFRIVRKRTRAIPRITLILSLQAFQGPLREVQLIPVSQAEVINHFSLLLSPKLNPFFVANIDSVEPSISRQGRAAS